MSDMLPISAVSL